MKIDLELFASRCAEFSGMPSKAAGLAELFRIVEREAFCDGVRTGRKASYAVDPSELHEAYGKKAITLQSRGGKARAEKLSPQRRSEIASAAAKSRWSESAEETAQSIPAPPVSPA